MSIKPANVSVKQQKRLRLTDGRVPAVGRMAEKPSNCGCIRCLSRFRPFPHPDILHTLVLKTLYTDRDIFTISEKQISGYAGLRCKV